MIYRPAEKFLWDTWVFVHPETNLVHLFYLVREDLRQPCRWIQHAVSQDWIDWQMLEEIPASDFGFPAMGTGMIFKTRGEYYLTVTGAGSAGQSIWLFRARNGRDLRGWQPVKTAAIISPDERWYETNGMPLAVMTAHCRDAFILEKDGAFHALVTMRVRSGPQGGRGCVGQAISSDLCQWELRPPLFHPGSFYQAEVPDYFEWNCWHYLLFNDASWFQRHDTPTRDSCSGTFYALSDRFAGPYRIPEEALLLGAGSLRFDGYVARQVQWGEQRLLYFHHARPRPAFGLPKQLCQAKNGELFGSAWEEGIRALRAGLSLLTGELRPFRMGPVSAGDWTRNAAREEISAECLNGGQHALWPDLIRDLEMSATIQLAAGWRAGLVVRFDPEQKTGLLVSVDRRRGQVCLERISEPSLHHPFCRTEPLDTARWPVRAVVRLRVVVRSEYVDVYLEDRWVFSAGLEPASPGSGQVGLFVSDGRAIFREIQTFVLAPLVEARLLSPSDGELG